MREIAINWAKANLPPGTAAAVYLDNSFFFDLHWSDYNGENIYGIGGDEVNGDLDLGSAGAGVLPGSGSGPALVGGAIGGVLGLSSIIAFIPGNWKTLLWSVIGGLGLARGVQVAKPVLIAAVRARGGAIAAVLAAYLATVLADTFIIDADIPFVPSIPGLGSKIPGDGALGEHHPGLMFGAGDVVTAQHGAVVKEWWANDTPFVMFMDGWMAARKANGSWKFWKPKKPLVYVPGGPMSRRTARRMATLYTNEKRRAKKDFNLVDSRQGQGQRGRKTIVVHESGPGNVNL